MTLPLRTPASAATAVDVRASLRGLAMRLGTDCLVEAPDGSVAAHAVVRPDPGPATTGAVLRSDAGVLHAALVDRRAAAVIPGGAVLTGQVDGAPAFVVPLSAGGDALGWWWGVGGSLPPSSELQLASRALAHELASGSALEDRLLQAVLDGEADAPMSLQRASQVHVVAVRAEAADPPRAALLHALRRALRMQARGGPPTLSGSTDLGLLLVVSGGSGSVRSRVESWLAHAGADVSTRLVAGCAPATMSPAGLRSAARLASALASLPGERRTFRLLEDARSELFVHRLLTALPDVTDLGRDPLLPLLEYDRQRGGDLAQTLLAWLQASGDVAAAAEQLTVHVNTLRYRVSRAEKILGVSLLSPAVRLELQLRLLAMLRGQPPETESRSAARPPDRPRAPAATDADRGGPSGAPRRPVDMLLHTSQTDGSPPGDLDD